MTDSGMRHLFITATDTDAGKSFVTLSLFKAMRELGEPTLALKPVACGHDGEGISPDVDILLRAQGMTSGEAGRINLYDFAAALAPSQAAAMEGVRIDERQLVDWCRARMQGPEHCLFEGVGGLMVPLHPRFLVSGWLAAMPELAVLLVVRARLGGINHALLTLEKLHAMERAPRWVVINDADGIGSAMVERHAQAMAPYLEPGCRLSLLPHTGGDGYSASQTVIGLARAVIDREG